MLAQRGPSHYGGGGVLLVQTPEDELEGEIRYFSFFWKNCWNGVVATSARYCVFFFCTQPAFRKKIYGNNKKMV